MNETGLSKVDRFLSRKKRGSSAFALGTDERFIAHRRRRILLKMRTKEGNSMVWAKGRGSLHRIHLLHSEGENSLLETDIGYNSPPASILCSIVHFFPPIFHFARRSSINDLTTVPNWTLVSTIWPSTTLFSQHEETQLRCGCQTS